MSGCEARALLNDKYGNEYDDCEKMVECVKCNKTFCDKHIYCSDCNLCNNCLIASSSESCKYCDKIFCLCGPKQPQHYIVNPNHDKKRCGTCKEKLELDETISHCKGCSTPEKYKYKLMGTLSHMRCQNCKIYIAQYRCEIYKCYNCEKLLQAINCDYCGLKRHVGCVSFGTCACASDDDNYRCCGNGMLCPGCANKCDHCKSELCGYCSETSANECGCVAPIVENSTNDIVVLYKGNLSDELAKEKALVLMGYFDGIADDIYLEEFMIDETSIYPFLLIAKYLTNDEFRSMDRNVIKEVIYKYGKKLIIFCGVTSQNAIFEDDLELRAKCEFIAL